MIKILINSLKQILPYRIWIELISYYQMIKFFFLKNYSCRGSIDKKLMDLIGRKKNGIFLEVGAYNGLSESVSLRFEKELNWTGILIEPNPLHFKFLRKNRKKNKCINSLCLSNKYKNSELYIKNLNQMSYIVDKKNNFFFNKYPIHKINELASKSNSGDFMLYKCNVDTLDNIFLKNNIKKIDLAIIDVEGSEIDLLEGINFDRVYIEYMGIETYNFEKLNMLMKKKNFDFIKKLHYDDYLFANKNDYK
tara:strand:+ start:147 stop:896 length:750 start_codon:yes stop_codon:yes gene_type:complete